MNASTDMRVLVVDDDPVIGQSFSRVLSGKGYAVTTAASGAEALERLKSEDFDMVFTDIRMPGMGGIEVTKRVKAKWPRLPVVVVTAFGSGEIEKEAMEAGVSAFLRKPLTPDMILGATQVLLHSIIKMAVTPVLAPPGRTFGATAKDIGLFFASGFLALGYVVLFPFVGMFLLAWVGFRALKKKVRGA